MNKKWLSKIISGCLLVTLVCPAVYGSAAEQQEPAAVFQDLTGHWAQSAAERMEELELMSGYEDGLFKPKQQISRAEFITVLDRVFGFNGKGTNSFKDVSSDAWYYASVMKANGSGIVNGVDADHFAPNAPITREDAAVLIDRAFQLSSGAESDAEAKAFRDYDAISSYAKKAFTYLVNAKILKGYNDMLLPKSPITRAESAVLLSGMITDFISKRVVYDSPKVEGNLIIRTPDVTVKNTVIQGNLLLTEGIQEGEVTLEGITVTGDTIIKGGGSHSVVFKNAKLGRVIVDKKGEPVRVALLDGSQAEAITLQQPTRLELSSDSSIASLNVDSEADASQIDNKGTIKRLNIDANGVMVNGKEVSPGLHAPLETGTTQPAPPTTPTTPTPTPVTEKPVQSTTIPDNKWELVWQDEFNESAIDLSKWTVMDTGIVYNNELEYYSPNNASIEKEGERSVLKIEAKKEDYKGDEYTSAKLISQNKGDWTYGKVVVRAKLPDQQGMWPAIWMMPTDESHYGGWPASGEIDIMELIGGATKDRVHGTLHFDSVQPDGSHGSDQNTYILPEGQSFSDDYHDFQIEWLPGVIRFYVDGQLYHEVKDWKSKGPGQPEYYTYPAPFDRPFYMILNLAVGGDWPGAPSNDFVSDEMTVDFVRVYEYKDLDSWPEVTGIDPPEPVQKREPQEDGNLIYNENFASAVDGNGVPGSWEFLLNAGGSGSVEVVDDAAKGKAAKVSITESGDVIYAVQLTQMPMYLKKEKTYKVTFDAKADANRTIMSKVNQFQKNWKNYSGEKVFELTTDWQSYEYTFDMHESTDNNARFEFNLGQNAETTYFANVKLIEIGDAEPLPEVPVERKPLQDGNLVYNGTFDQGKNRLAFWSSIISPEAEAQISVNNFLAFPIYERQLVVDVTDGGTATDSVTVSQPGLLLEKNTEYGIYFEAKSDAPRSIEVDLVSQSDNTIQFPRGNSLTLSSELQTYSKSVIIGDGDAEVESTLKLLFGGADGTVYVDNVRLVKRGAPVHVAGYAHIAAAAAWELRGVQLEDSSEGGKNVSHMSEGDLLQYKIDVERSANYVISARVASGLSDSQIRLSVKDEAGATVSQSVYQLGETGGWQEYKTIYFEPVRLDSEQGYYVEFEGYDYNTLWVDLSENKIKNDGGTSDWNLNTGDGSTISLSEEGELVVQLPGTGTEWWDHLLQQYNMSIEKGKTYKLEVDAYASTPKTMQVVVSQNGGEFTKYLEQEAALTTAKTRFTYTFTMDKNTDPSAVIVLGLGKAAVEGGAHSVSIDNVLLYEVNRVADVGGQPVGINLLNNGDFSKGTEGWFSYAAVDANQLTLSIVEGKLQATIGSVGDNPWDRQVINEGFAIQQGSKYQLTFTAKAATERKLGLGIGWVDVPDNYAWHGYFGNQIDLTTDEQTFTFTFDATSDSYMNARITFDMGNIPGGNAGNTSITLSDVSLVNIGPAGE